MVLGNTWSFSESVLGLDLAGSPKRRTGYAYLRKGKLFVGIIHTDEEILELVKDFKLVAIDAPLSLPKGRESLEKLGPHFRECDLMLRQKGIRFFPATLGPMRVLTKRAMALKESLTKLGIEVIETFPGGLYDLLGVKRRDKRAIVNLFKSFGLDLEERAYKQDELDAVACLLSGLRYLNSQAVVFEGSDGTIFV